MEHDNCEFIPNTEELLKEVDEANIVPKGTKKRRSFDFMGEMMGKCPECGREFFIYSRKDYAWKIGSRAYCSYSCKKVALEDVPRKKKIHHVGFRNTGH